MLAAGLFSPLPAAMIISVMLVASVTVRLADGFFVQNRSCEYTRAPATGARVLAFTGRARCLWTLGIVWSGSGPGVTALGLVGAASDSKPTLTGGGTRAPSLT
jgi:uncharacterized membrane protein YphA (DoxX/SURF4 family)